MNRRNLIIAAVVLAVLAAPVVWWLASPLFRTDAVDEDFPFDVPTTAEIEEMTAEEAETIANELADKAMEMADEMTDEQMDVLETQINELAEKMPDSEMDEEMPEMETETEETAEAADEWLVAAQGMFRDADPFHTGEGTATIFTQGDQSILRFEAFSVTNGPDLHVLLVENIDGTSSGELGEYVDLGQLKGNVGNQNYELPADIDLSQYEGVMIYCMPFHVVFATADF